MRCSIKNIKLPPAPTPTRPKRASDLREDAAILRAVHKEELIRKAEKEIEKSDNPKKHQRPRLQKLVNNEERELIIKMWNEGKMGKEIAEAIGLDVKRTFGVIAQLQKRGMIKKRFRYLGVDPDKILQDLKAGKNVTQIAQEMGKHRKTIQRWKAKFIEEGKL